MRFRFIEEHTETFSAKRMCDVLDVSERGLRAYRSRPASQRQRADWWSWPTSRNNRGSAWAVMAAPE